MVQLRFLSGAQSGQSFKVGRFPVIVGRGAGAGLRLEDAGVWDQHIRLDFEPKEGFVVNVLANALACVNGEPFTRALVRNGDVLEIGAVKLQFWLSPTTQRSFQFREILTWISLGLLCVAQGYVIYRLLH